MDKGPDDPLCKSVWRGFKLPLFVHEEFFENLIGMDFTWEVITAASEMAIGAIHNVLSHLPWQWVDTQGAILLLCMLLVAKFMWNLPPKNSPPGPFPLPIVGNILSINLKNPISSFCQIVEKYGDISMVDLGQNRCILLTGYKGFKEAFVERADSFTDRPSYPLNDRLCKGLGLISSNGHMWKQQRRFALSTLRYFGVGKKTLKNSILDESGFLCKAFQMNQGTPFDPHYLMNNSVGNIICSLVFGHRFEYDDPKFHLILKCSDEVFQLPATFWGRMYNQYPNLMHFLPGKHQSAFSSCNKVKKFIQEEVNRHKEDRDASNPRDYIDCYLDEIEKCRDSSAGFTEENLLYCVMDLFGAGTETTSKTLIWAILYMAKYPEIQENVHAEIDRVIGPFRQPSMEDRATMPYTYAVLHEIQRFGNVITFTPPRVSNKDTTVAGYKVSKGVMVLPMLKPILQDKKEYATSDQFNPRHFLDEDGKFLKRENFIPFSIGKRMCPGEQLAWMELFLFFTSLLQRFTFCPPEEQELSLESVVGITTGPKPFKICAVPR